jgi:protoheme IX farnesyltransferase
MFPAEGLAFGLALSIMSFYILAGLVNWMSAVLSVIGIVYYVWLYSILLKKNTVQNIVIGGGAGAIPPMVGWAAATGNLSVGAWFMFAIIFFWTPPHFWALSIVRKKDYERAGVPMLPVVQGEKETRRQIWLYTLVLVAITILMPLLGLSGAIFMISALILGVWLVSVARRVYKGEGNKIAWKMYRYSSMYLMFIFLALVVDALA